MKNIKNKFYVDPFVYLIILIALITGMFKSISIIMLIIIIHELGHIYFLRKYDYTVKRIEIYPFGGVTKIDKNINTPLHQEMYISIGGIIFQMILFLIFIILYETGTINDNTFFIFKKFNYIFMIFNLLPIVPLDGNVLVNCLLERYLPFKKAYFINIVISIIFVLLFLTYNYVFSFNNYVIVSFLVYKIFMAIKEFKYIHNRFLLERYLYEFPYRKIANERGNSTDILKKETLHFFKADNRYIHEKQVLSKLFDRST